jgi:predicted NAD/FAD-dependent oxidoreductase
MARIVIVGAGMCGLTAATGLERGGHHVTLLDKGRRHGGRLATRTVDGTIFDTGALSFRRPDGSSDPDGAAEHWIERGLVTMDGELLRGRPTMRSLPAALSGPLDVRLAVQVTSVVPRDGGWRVTADEERVWDADAVIMTAPAPQTRALLASDDANSVDSATLEALAQVEYAPCLSVLAVPRGGASVDLAGGTLRAEGDVAVVRDNLALGVSPSPALTLQADVAFSREHFDHDRAETGRILADRAELLLGVPLDVVHVHGWRYAQVCRPHTEACLVDVSAGAPLIVAGDAFGAGTCDAVGFVPDGVARAMRSGRAAADAAVAMVLRT